MKISYVVLKGPLRGRLGNQFFPINIALQCARALDIPFFLPKNLVSFVAPNLVRHSMRSFTELVLSRSRREVKLMVENQYFMERIPEEFIDQNKIVIPNKMFSELFFNLNCFHPRTLFDLYPNEVVSTNNHDIALYFRGGDFQSWNENALTNLHFYVEALEKLEISIDSLIDVYSDDPNHLVVRKILEYFPNARLCSTKDWRQDFLSLSNYKTLVMSPSTFSMWAAILGQDTKIILPHQWIEIALKKQDIFWLGVMENKQNIFREVVIV